MIDKNLEKIKKIADSSDGIFKTEQLERVGLYRRILKPYVDQGILIKESKGIYTFSDNLIDDYKVIQTRSKKVVFSYGTALYLLGMSDRVPHVIDVTVPQGYNVSRIKKDFPQIRFHYVKRELWDLGIVSAKAPMGSKVYIYDKERCICDLIRDKNQVDMQLYTQAIKEYFRIDNNVRKIIKYGKIFGIESKIRTYIEVLG